MPLARPVRAGAVGPATLERSALFADIAGSTRLVVEAGDDTARVLLLRYVGLLEATARAHGAEHAERVGDQVFCVFRRSDDAMAAAAAMHERVDALSVNDRLARPMRIRTGLVHGTVVCSEEGYFGGTVHRAARLVALAKAGQILTTRRTLDGLAPRWRDVARYFDRRVLRGDSAEEEIHEVLWDASTTSVTRRPLAPQPDVPCLAVVLEHEGTTLRVDQARPRVEIGRDPACDLRVRDTAASRLHATVEWQRERIRLTDVSTNGTLVERRDGSRVRLHRESATLEDEGVLRLGATGAEGGALVRYRCTTERA